MNVDCVFMYDFSLYVYYMTSFVSTDRMTVLNTTQYKIMQSMKDIKDPGFQCARTCSNISLHIGCMCYLLEPVVLIFYAK